MRRRGRSPPATGQPPVVTFRDFDSLDTATGVSVRVHGAELQGLFEALAADADVPAATLLANASIEAGQPLKCHLVARKPRNWSCQLDSQGYLQAYFKQSRTVRGHTFCGTGSRNDDEYRPPRSKRAAQPTLPASPTPQRAKRACSSRRPVDSSPDMSPGSPSAGSTQPVPMRLHRAAFLSTCDNPEADSRLEIRHICGNRACAVVSHFRPGTAAQNSQDREYHKLHPGCSPESFPPLQH